MLHVTQSANCFSGGSGGTFPYVIGTTGGIQTIDAFDYYSSSIAIGGSSTDSTFLGCSCALAPVLIVYDSTGAISWHKTLNDFSSFQVVRFSSNGAKLIAITN